MLDKNARISSTAAIKRVRKLAQNHEGYFVCEYCGRWWHSIEVHHIVPKGAGGSDEANNLIALCPMMAQHSCHRRAQEYKIDQEELWKIAKEREEQHEGIYQTPQENA